MSSRYYRLIPVVSGLSRHLSSVRLVFRTNGAIVRFLGGSESSGAGPRMGRRSPGPAFLGYRKRTTHQCDPGWLTVARGYREAQRASRPMALSAYLRFPEPLQQKTPRWEGGALLGLLQGGEICISIYVDPWEVGGLSCAAGARRGKRRGPYSGEEPSQEVLCLDGPHRQPHANPLTAYERMCDLCVSGITDLDSS